MNGNQVNNYPPGMYPQQVQQQVLQQQVVPPQQQVLPPQQQVLQQQVGPPVTVSTESSTRRRKTPKEQIQNALAIQNDYKNRNIVTDPDREEDEYFCFIGKYPR